MERSFIDTITEPAEAFVSSEAPTEKTQSSIVQFSLTFFLTLLILTVIFSLGVWFGRCFLSHNSELRTEEVRRFIRGHYEEGNRRDDEPVNENEAEASQGMPDVVQ